MPSKSNLKNSKSEVIANWSLSLDPSTMNILEVDKLESPENGHGLRIKIVYSLGWNFKLFVTKVLASQSHDTRSFGKEIFLVSSFYPTIPTDFIRHAS